MARFGGDWTQMKAEVVEKYASAYLQIMKNQKWQLLYFDGFAGSGHIQQSANNEIEGVARRILSIKQPRAFDMYYFVELNHQNAESLVKMIHQEFEAKESTTFVVEEDCNNKLEALAEFLKTKGANFRALAFVDPYGMELKWHSLVGLKSLGIDLWLLIPTGIGANRLLTKNGNIPKSWQKKLESFLGLQHQQITDVFYKKDLQQDLFDSSGVIKEKQSIERLHSLYKQRLNEIFKFVSNALVLKNSRNSIMFHFLLASNNSTAQKIANDIIKKYRL